jgi:hypothetical protein
MEQLNYVSNLHGSATFSQKYITPSGQLNNISYIINEACVVSLDASPMKMKVQSANQLKISKKMKDKNENARLRQSQLTRDGNHFQTNHNILRHRLKEMKTMCSVDRDWPTSTQLKQLIGALALIGTKAQIFNIIIN